MITEEWTRIDVEGISLVLLWAHISIPTLYWREWTNYTNIGRHRWFLGRYLIPGPFEFQREVLEVLVNNELSFFFFVQFTNSHIGNFRGKASIWIPFVPVLWVVPLRIRFCTPNVPDLPRHKNWKFLAMRTNILTSSLLGRTLQDDSTPTATNRKE